jgi:hypothetical protein
LYDYIMETQLQIIKNLPPGLVLPTADIPTEKYRKENFRPGECTNENIFDLGTLAVALAAWAAPITERVSLMPTQRDIIELHTAGYGVAMRTLNRRGGIKWLQRTLGFYPEGYVPPEEELTPRLVWVTTHAYYLDSPPETEHLPPLKQLLQWGSERNLLPAPKIILPIYNSDLPRLRKMLSVERKVERTIVTNQDLYRLGARVIQENNGPMGGDELDKKYGNEFRSNLARVIKWRFGSLTNFWGEFDYLPTASGLNKDDLLNCGVRWNIQYGPTNFATPLLRSLSRAKRFANPTTIAAHFDSIPLYRAAVETGYNVYLQVRTEFEHASVDPEVFRLACRKFEATEEFEAHLHNNRDYLVKLSALALRETLQIMDRGLNLEDEGIFKQELSAITTALQNADLWNERALRFCLNLIPRFAVEEAINNILNTEHASEARPSQQAIEWAEEVINFYYDNQEDPMAPYAPKLGKSLQRRLPAGGEEALRQAGYWLDEQRIREVMSEE